MSVCLPTLFMLSSRGDIKLKLITNIQVYGTLERRKTRLLKRNKKYGKLCIIFAALCVKFTASSKPIENSPLTYNHKIGTEPTVGKFDSYLTGLFIILAVFILCIFFSFFLSSRTFYLLIFS